MDKNKVKKEYNKKIQNLAKLNKYYYELSKPLVKDYEYDKIKADILFLEKKYDFLESENSPSKIVGFKPSKTFKKVLHRVPMLSLSNAFDEEDLINFEKKINNFLDQKRLISADINVIKIINVYVPNGSSLESSKFEYKINWLNCLSSFLDDQEKKGELICLMGDFNVAPSNLDIHDPKKYEGGIMASEIERNALNNVLKKRLIDSFRIFEQNTGHWSWWDYRNNAFELNKGWRIDHIYISKELSSNLKSCVIDSSPRGNLRPSDHAPVMIDLNLSEINADFFEDEDNFFEI